MRCGRYVRDRLGAAVLLLGVGPLAVTAQEPAGEAWGEAARRDVLAAYETYAADHPGMHDPDNPAFPALLARARDSALALADRAGTRSDYASALAAFSAPLQDGHALAFALPPAAGTGSAGPLWPGFVAAWRGDLRVHGTGADAPAPPGSRIEACDGRAADDLLREAFDGRYARASEAGQWWDRTPQAFVARPGRGDPRPTSCRFHLPDGSVRDIALSWVPAPDGVNRMIALASDGERTPIGLTEPRPGLHLIGLPDFAPDDAGLAAYRALFDELAARREQLGSARAVVIDLRHNNGGSSHWPRRTAEELWGTEAVDERISRYFRDVRILWRASERNAAHLELIVQTIRERGDSASAESLARLGREMRDGLGRGDLYVTQLIGSSVAEGAVAPSRFSTPVYVITPGRCASACLDAVDIFTRFDNVRLIGAPTSGDSQYMEVRVDDLPSGNGRLVVPMKIWAGRPRAGGQVYEPDILVTDLDWSTATFLDRIEADLRGG